MNSIRHPRRVLVLSAPERGVLDVIKELTGSAPRPNNDGSAAGLTHEWDVRTAYYNAKVPIWVDEISDVHAWREEFLKPEAREVVEAVGAWVYCFRQISSGERDGEVENVLKAIQAVTEEHAGYGVEAAMLAVALPDKRGLLNRADRNLESLEDLCVEYRFELIEVGAQGKNEYGERTGFQRLKEALEANDWDTTADGGDEPDLDDPNINADANFGVFTGEEAEMTAEISSMKTALFDNDEFNQSAEDSTPLPDQAAQVDGLERMMGRLLAVKEQAADLSEAQRKRMAAQAVRQLLNDEGNV